MANYYVSSGIASDGIVLSDYDSMTVYSGGTANDTQISDSACLRVFSGGMAVSTMISSGGLLRLQQGTGSVTTILSGGLAYAYSHGVADGATVFSGGTLYAFNQGSATNAAVHSGGHMYAYDSSVMTNAVVNPYGDLYVYSKALVAGAEVYSSGYLHVYSQGSATGITVHSGGRLRISYEASATDIEIHSGGYLSIDNGGSADRIEYDIPDSYMYVCSNGIANHTTVKSGSIFVYSGGTARNTEIKSGCTFYMSNSLADSTTISSGGVFLVHSDSLADGLTVASGGRVTVSESRLTGRIQVERGADVYLNEDSVFDFDLTQSSVKGDALVDGFSRIMGITSATLTVREDQAAGVYLLARNAYDFDRRIMVRDDSDYEYGNLSIGQPITVNDLSYSLILNGSSLFLSIREPGPDTMAPAVISVRQSQDAPTLRPVTLTVDFADDVALQSALYRIGEDGAWTDYVGGVTVTENTTVYFKAVDSAGHESEVVGHTVSNIENNAHAPIYVYLDFDGENTSYNNRDLNVSCSVSVANPGFSDDRKQAILSELIERYAADGVVFTLTRPQGADYSTLYFGKSGDFAKYGSYFGIAETIDQYNRTASDKAFVLLDHTYSTDQIVSVAGTVLDHILGYTYRKNDLELRDYAAATYYLETQWNQTDPYNKYCPIYPETGSRCLTGCTNTAAAQIINYWIEKGVMDLSLALNDSDYAVISANGSEIKVTSDPATASSYKYLSYAQTNELLANYRPGNTDTIAALSFAAGIVQGANYDNGLTSTAYDKDLFIRSGMQNKSGFYHLHIDFSGQGLSGGKLETLIREVLSGRPVATSILFAHGDGGDAGHAVVTDGYNSATGEFHLNYGWGGTSDGWYTVDALNDLYGIEYIMVGIAPDILPSISVSGLSVEQASVVQGEAAVIHFSVSNTGLAKTPEETAYVYCGDTLLSSQVLDYLYSGETRSFSFAVDTSQLSPGENTIALSVAEGEAFAVIEVLEPERPEVAKSDIDGNGISDVMFVWTGEHGEGNYQHGFWMNGTSEWRSQNGGHPAEWVNLGCHDMSGDGKADSVLVGNVVVNGVKGAYIGYYADAIDSPDGSTWMNIGYLNNADDIDWKNAVGNLTGNESGANSIVWYTHELGALGAWTDGTDQWVSIASGFDASWTLIGCGDFDGDGADSVVMSLNSGANYYAVALDGAFTDLGESDSGWAVRAIGDFSCDGRDDIVAFHEETGLVAMWGDGDSAKWSQLGQLDAADWFVVGAGDYNGDAQDDLLVRQYSTGMLGYYSSGDMSKWNTLGYGVDMSWTVIA